jgi:hypothetical protein
VSDELHYRYDPKLGYIECSAEEAWDSEKEDSVELGPVYTPPVKKLLTDAGTRFNHINDLLDYLNDGLVAVENSLERYENAKDHTRRKKLIDALSLVRLYQEHLANMDGYKWDLNNMLDKCVPERGVLEGIRKARIEPTKALEKKAAPAPPEDPDLQGV